MGECQCTPYNIVVHVLVHVSLAVDIIVSLISIRKIFCGAETVSTQGLRKVFKCLWKHIIYFERIVCVVCVMVKIPYWECRIANIHFRKKS